MCFSAPASFIAAAVAGGAGVAAMARTTRRAELPLAAMPLFFGVQQTIEGFLWLTLPVAPSGPESTALTETFLHFALVFWPIYAPLAAYAIEPDERRRKHIAVCLAAGFIVSAYFFLSMRVSPQLAIIEANHIVYSGDANLPDVIRLFYPLATCIAPLLSSYRVLRVLALFIILGSVAAYLSFWEAFTSVWCYFAAAASGVIVFHFEHERRRLAATFPG